MRRTTLLEWLFMSALISALTTVVYVPHGMAGSDNDTFDDLLFTLEVHPQTIDVGEEINITCVVTNLDSVERTVWTQAGGYMFDVEVHNSTFSWRWTEGRQFPIIPSEPIPLQPGENYTEKKTWDLYIFIDEMFVPPQEGPYVIGLPDFFVRIFVGVEMIPEFPSSLILPLFMMATLLIVVACRRRARATKEPLHKY